MAKYLKIFKNNTEVSGKTFTESTAKLEEIFPEINYNLLSSVIILSQGMPNKFSSFNPSGRKDLLEKLTKSDFMIEDLKMRVAARLDNLTKQLRDLEDRQLINQTKVNSIKVEIDKTDYAIATMIKPDFDAEIKKLEDELAKNKKVQDELEAKATALNKEAEAINLLLLEESGHKADEVTLLNESFSSKYNELITGQTKISTQISTLQAEISRLKNIKDTCPTCGQKLPGVYKADTNSQESQVSRLNSELTVIKEAVSTCLAKKEAYQTEINKKYEQQLAKLTMQNATKKREISFNNEAIKKVTATILSINTKLTKLNSDKATWDSKHDELLMLSKRLAENLTAITAAMVEANKMINNINNRLAIVKKMESLVKRDFRGFLLGNIISYIDKKAKDYCEIVFGTRELSLSIDGNALDITYCDKLIDNLSGGEKTRVDLILQLALRDTLVNYLGFNSNIIVLDEVTDFLDKKSCKAVMDLLAKELVTIESVFLVSHHAEELELPIDSELQVIKTVDGISQVIN